MIKLVLIALTVSLLTACASVNQLATEASLQQKAAGALGVNPDNVVVTNKQANGESVQFTASVRDKTYHCSYQSSMTKQTQTVCN